MEDLNPSCPLVAFTQTLLLKPELHRAVFQLQHHSGFNINIIFYLLWAAKSSLGRLTKKQLKFLESQIVVWHQRVLTELKYTHALMGNHTDPLTNQIKQMLQNEIMRAHAIEQRLLYEAGIKLQAHRRSSEQQLADACASLVRYCELKNDFCIPEDQTAFEILFATVFSDLSQYDIEKQLSVLSGYFQMMAPIVQQRFWD